MASLRPLTALAQGQKSECASGKARGRRRLGPARSIVMREVVIAILAAFLIGIMVAALVVHFLL